MWGLNAEPGVRLCVPYLEPQFQPKLELAWIEGRRCLAGVRPEHVDVGDVEFVDQIEHVDRPVELESLGQVEGAANAQVGENRGRLNAGIALKVSHQCAVHPTCGLEKSCRRIP